MRSSMALRRSDGESCSVTLVVRGAPLRVPEVVFVSLIMVCGVLCGLVGISVLESGRRLAQRCLWVSGSMRFGDGVTERVS